MQLVGLERLALAAVEQVVEHSALDSAAFAGSSVEAVAASFQALAWPELGLASEPAAASLAFEAEPESQAASSFAGSEVRRAAAESCLALHSALRSLENKQRR